MDLAFHVAQVQDYVMMIAVVSEDVTAGTEWPPADANLVQFMDQRRGLLFSLRSDHPVDRAADSQTRQLRKAPPPFRTKTHPACNLLDQIRVHPFNPRPI